MNIQSKQNTIAIPHWTYNGKVIIYSLVLMAFCLFTYLTYQFLPVHVNYYSGYSGPIIGTDWKGAYHGAIQRLVHNENPYSTGNLFNPLWTFLILLPIGLLPDSMGAAIMFSLCLFSFGFIAHKLGAKPWLIALTIFSPGSLMCAVNGNIDWLAIMGVFLPRKFGVFLLLIKPQIGLPIVLYWTIDSYKKNGVIGVINLLFPVFIAYFISFIIIPESILPVMLPTVSNPTFLTADCNVGIWPIGIPIGFVIMLYAFKKKKEIINFAASFFISPYINETSTITLNVGFLPNQWFSLAIFLSSWIYWIFTNRFYKLIHLIGLA